nr:MAG TPA: hypothetical protein [Caudoviricetes sp.]
MKLSGCLRGLTLTMTRRQDSGQMCDPEHGITISSG